MKRDELVLNERNKYDNWLSGQEGVTGTGIGLDRDGRHCIKVYTSRMPEETKRRISSVLAGVPFEFEETGEFRAF